ncbi:MAG TPA: hypothetical protein VHM90_11760, partial [Phycisphaerae bacterium]|nr:hypothetical protein [Phycisphaerae bacterium]
PAAEDPALKEPMLRIIRDVLIPAVPPLTLAANLAREGLPLLLIGAWPNLHLPVPSDAQRISFDQYTPDAWGSAALLIHLSPEGTFSPLLLEAIAGGVAVAAPTHPTSAHAGAFPGGLAADRDFAQPAPRQLIAAVKTLLRDGARRERLATAAKSAFALAAAR